MIGVRPTIFLFILAFIWSFFAIAHGIDPGEDGSDTSSLDIDRAFQQISNPACIVLNWPLMSSVIYNNPPKSPNMPLGDALGIPGANYSYVTSTIDPDGDQLLFIFDWGDEAVSKIGPVSSGALTSANHTWTKRGTFKVRTKAIDSKGEISGWSEPLNVSIDAPPGNPSVPSGPISNRPGVFQTYAVSAIDPDGDQITYTFDWGDGSTSVIGPMDSGAMASANHSWREAGTYLIRAMATDSQGRSSEWSEPLKIELNTPPNEPSTPSGPGSGRPGVIYNYTVSAADPDGDQINYTFDWGDGTTSVFGPFDSGVAAGSSHAWTKGGRYQVKVDATDSRGATSGWSEAWIIAINAPPNSPSTPSGPVSVYAWASNNFSASAIDPDEDQVVCTFDWGDGNTSTTELVASGSNANASYSWSNEGTYRIRVIAMDNSGETSGWSDNLTINVIANGKPNAPISLFGASLGYTGIPLSYFTLANDQDNDKVCYAFNWGDGTLSTTDFVDSGSVERASHVWSKAGTYQVKGNAIDSKGARSIWSGSLNITIADNEPPAIPIMPSGPTSGRSLIAYKYATIAADPDGDPVKYVFDWGDGTTSWTGLGFIKSGISQSLIHKWSNAGTFQVKAMSMDEKGASSEWSNPLTVNMS